MQATVRWDGGMHFTGATPEGHEVPMDAPVAAGGAASAARPIELLLLGLAGCTAMDVISILRKKRKTVDSLTVTVEADQQEEYPRRLTAARLVYRVNGPDLDEESVRRSVELSQEKYCSVGATLGTPVDLSWSVEVGR